MKWDIEKCKSHYFSLSGDFVDEANYLIFISFPISIITESRLKGTVELI